jgi:hypothetical protein
MPDSAVQSITPIAAAFLPTETRMFPLRDRTRRWICRTIFFAVGVVPTLSIIGWCMAMTSPGRVTEVREKFADAVGLDVHFDELSYPRPDAMLFEGLKLADPETGEALAQIQQLEIRTDEQHPVWVISQAEINAAQTDWLLRLIQRRLQLGPNRHDSALRIKVLELTLRWPDGSQTFVDGEAQFSTSENSRSLTATARPANSPSTAAPIELHAERSFNASGAIETNVEFKSTETPLPCSLFATLAHLENHAGLQSTWQGTMKRAETAHRWWAELSGRLNEVDLHAAVSNQFPQQLNGRAEVDISRMIVENGRLAACEGAVLARDGSIGGQLLTMLKYLNLQTTVPIQPPLDRLLTFSELHFGFSIDATGMAMMGQCGNAEAGTVMRNQTGPLAKSTNAARVSMATLINVLVPDNRQSIPATKQADWLFQMLPTMGDR